MDLDSKKENVSQYLKKFKEYKAYETIESIADKLKIYKRAVQEEIRYDVYKYLSNVLEYSVDEIDEALRNLDNEIESVSICIPINEQNRNEYIIDILNKLEKNLKKFIKYIKQVKPNIKETISFNRGNRDNNIRYENEYLKSAQKSLKEATNDYSVLEREINDKFARYFNKIKKYLNNGEYDISINNVRNLLDAIETERKNQYQCLKKYKLKNLINTYNDYFNTCFHIYEHFISDYKMKDNKKDIEHYYKKVDVSSIQIKLVDGTNKELYKQDLPEDVLEQLLDVINNSMSTKV